MQKKERSCSLSPPDPRVVNNIGHQRLKACQIAVQKSCQITMQVFAKYLCNLQQNSDEDWVQVSSQSQQSIFYFCWTTGENIKQIMSHITEAT
jgi:hypothetical protein